MISSIHKSASLIQRCYCNIYWHILNGWLYYISTHFIISQHASVGGTSHQQTLGMSIISHSFQSFFQFQTEYVLMSFVRRNCIEGHKIHSAAQFNIIYYAIHSWSVNLNNLQNVLWCFDEVQFLFYIKRVLYPCPDASCYGTQIHIAAECMDCMMVQHLPTIRALITVKDSTQKQIIGLHDGPTFDDNKSSHCCER